jgi:hypothetical protein
MDVVAAVPHTPEGEQKFFGSFLKKNIFLTFSLTL